MSFDPALIISTAKSGTIPPEWKTYPLSSFGVIISFIFGLVALGMTSPFILPWAKAYIYVAAAWGGVALIILITGILATIRSMGRMLVLTPDGFVIWNKNFNLVIIAVDYQEVDNLSIKIKNDSDGPPSYYIKYTVSGKNRRWRIPDGFRRSSDDVATLIFNAYTLAHSSSPSEQYVSMNPAGLPQHLNDAIPQYTRKPQLDQPFKPLEVLWRVKSKQVDLAWQVYSVDHVPAIPIGVIIIFAALFLLLLGFIFKMQNGGLNSFEIGAVITACIVLLGILILVFTEFGRNRKQLDQTRAASSRSKGNIIVLAPAGYVIGNPETGTVIEGYSYTDLSHVAYDFRRGLLLTMKNQQTTSSQFSRYFRDDYNQLLSAEIIRSLQRYHVAEKASYSSQA